MLNNKTYHITTYGCQMNEHESEKLAGILCALGATEAQDKQDADIILLNTCCVRDTAESRIIGNIGALKHVKKTKPNAIIGICGCMTQQTEVADKIKRTFPFVDIIFGTHDMDSLPEMIEKVLHGDRVMQVGGQRENLSEEPPKHRSAPPLGLVNIMYGCNNFCSYCIVPYVRGSERSRPPKDVVSEVQGILLDGYKQVTLLGQNVNSYSFGFAELLANIAGNTGVKRVRFMTSHPTNISDELLQTMSRYDNICKQLHLPLQSGDDEILSAMNRKYSLYDYEKTIEKARKLMPDITISTDIIAGFPGETDAQFENTLGAVERIGFDSCFTFQFSKRSGTVAAQMPNQISTAVKSERIHKLVELAGKITHEKNSARIGKILPVLVHGKSTRGAGVCGLTDGGITVNFPGEESLIGQICDVLITDAKRTTLVGKIV